MSARQIKKRKKILKDLKVNKKPENSIGYALYDMELKAYISMEYMLTCDEKIKYTNDLNKAYITESKNDGTIDIIDLDIEINDDRLYSLYFIPVIGTILGLIADSNEFKKLNNLTENEVGNFVSGVAAIMIMEKNKPAIKY